MSDTYEGRTFDWRPRHDERSRNFPVRSLVRGIPRRTKVLWRPGEILDQGSIGACTGMAWTGEALASPVRVDFSRLSAGPEWPREPGPFAFALYHWAQKNDEWQGESYEGSSVLAAAKGMQEVGLIKSYWWAFNIGDVINALLVLGPAVLGIPWLSGMMDAPNGELRAVGRIVGGHAILAAGYVPTYMWSDGSSEEAIVLVQSWGRDWGKNGFAYIRCSELAGLLGQQGEAAVPFGRSYGRLRQAWTRLVAQADARKLP